MDPHHSPYWNHWCNWDDEMKWEMARKSLGEKKHAAGLIPVGSSLWANSCNISGATKGQGTGLGPTTPVPAAGTPSMVL